LTQIILHEKIDVAFLQEPYTIRKNVAGFAKYFKIFACGNGRKRTAVIVNKNTDVGAIQQVSDENVILREITYKGLRFYGDSLYLAIDQDIERDIGKVEEIVELTKGNGLILSIDSNSRSKLWHDKYTNQRGKSLENFIITSDFVITKEATEIPTFETTRGHSWIDLALCDKRNRSEDGRAERPKAARITS
jgi:hypothetical protein